MKLSPLASAPAFSAAPQREVSRASCEWRSQPLTLSAGEVAPQASQAVTLTHGQTVILATLTMGPPPARADFRPLRVDYSERPGAIGALPGGHSKREGRASDHEVRVSRLIDRALRPLFDEGERRELHVTITVLSASQEDDLIGLSLTAAGAAAHCSSLPFAGPVAGCRLTSSDSDWLFAAHREGVVMLEGSSTPSPAEEVAEALELTANELEPLWSCVEELAAQVKPVKQPYQSAATLLDDPAFDAALSELAAALSTQDKRARERLYGELLSRLKAEVSAPAEAVELTLWSLARAWLRSEALEGKRQDGRAPHELRAMDIELGRLPRSAGSALITRGSTQVLVGVNHGSGEAPVVSGLFDRKRSGGLFCHYNFPPFATHEARPSWGVSRRELGHGMVIQRAIEPMFQPKAPQLMTRVLSDVLSSDGSSSMLSVCGATLALAQAGAPLLSPVVGLSIGLVSEEEGPEDQRAATLLMDITGDEDFYGDMDLKVTGTSEGLTSLHLDNKLGALPWSLVAQALKAASEAHGLLLSALAPHLEAFAPAKPRFEQRVQLAPQRVGRVIGKQGSNLKALCAELEVSVDINDDALATVVGHDEANVSAAIERLRAQGEPLKVGERFQARIENIKDYGVFVSFNGHNGLVHVSEMDKSPSDYSEGEALEVTLIGVDQQGRLKLSLKR